MLKKFVSNALLSVVMDKKARDKLNAVRDAKRPAAEPAASAQDAGSELDIPRMVPGKGSRPPAPSPPRPPSAVVDEDPGVLIRQALDSAEQELVRKQNPTHKGKPVSAERQALIDEAMAIHRSKSHVLDDLDEDQREKLYVMAMQALNDQIDR